MLFEPCHSKTKKIALNKKSEKDDDEGKQTEDPETL